jgi:hypothetical protein
LCSGRITEDSRRYCYSGTFSRNDSLFGLLNDEILRKAMPKDKLLNNGNMALQR